MKLSKMLGSSGILAQCCRAKETFLNDGQHLSVIPDTDKRNSSQMGQILLSGRMRVSRSCPHCRTDLTGFRNQTKLGEYLNRGTVGIPPLNFSTHDMGFSNLVKKSPQAKRILTVAKDVTHPIKFNRGSPSCAAPLQVVFRPPSLGVRRGPAGASQLSKGA
jgi:hypothetical protein